MVGAVRNHWFYVLLPICLMATWVLAREPETLADPITAEQVFLFDFGLFLPVFYFIYLRRDVGVKGAAIRALPFMGAGVWFIGFLMPAGCWRDIARPQRGALGRGAGIGADRIGRVCGADPLCLWRRATD